MFYTDEAVNYILNYSKTLVEQINTKKEIVPELKNIQCLIFAGMVSYYGFEYIEEIYKSFLKTAFIYTNKSAKELLESKKDLTTQLKLYLEKFNVGAFLNKEFSVDFYGRYHINQQIYVIESKNEEPVNFLEKIVHEVNHAVNSIVSPICIRDNRRVSRIGLGITLLEGDEAEGVTLEEDFNVLQTAEIMDHILEFTNYNIEDKELREELRKIRYAAGFKRQGYGYETTVPLVRGLYEDSYFNSLLKKKRVTGDIKDIRNIFDQKVGEGSFKNMAQKLDEIDQSVNMDATTLSKGFAVKQMVKKYKCD